MAPVIAAEADVASLPKNPNDDVIIAPADMVIAIVSTIIPVDLIKVLVADPPEVWLNVLSIVNIFGATPFINLSEENALCIALSINKCTTSSWLSSISTDPPVAFDALIKWATFRSARSSDPVTVSVSTDKLSPVTLIILNAGVDGVVPQVVSAMRATRVSLLSAKKVLDMF